ncbi:hypothetical protein Tco_0660782 [Tanacetum coccineum]
MLKQNLLKDKELKEVSSQFKANKKKNKKKYELSQEKLNQMVIIVPDEGINVEALQTKYPIYWMGKQSELVDVLDHEMSSFIFQIAPSSLRLGNVDLLLILLTPCLKDPRLASGITRVLVNILGAYCNVSNSSPKDFFVKPILNLQELKYPQYH